MPSELTLFFSDESGHEQAIVVNTNPFTIGRQEGNELVIPDTSLSRRHALLTFFNGVAQITDCGSQNGTFVNGRQISGNAVLKNGDTVTIGHHCQLRVRLAEVKETVVPVPNPPTSAPRIAAAAHATPVAVATPESTTSTSALQLSPTMMALIATGAIVVLAGVLIVVLVLRKPKPPVDESGIVFSPSPAATTDPTESTPTPTMSVPATNDQFEKSLVQAIRSISNDQNYPFTPALQAEIKRKAEQFATPTLANTLRAIAAHGADTTNQIKNQGLKPALLIYLALAETNGGQTNDPLAVARQTIPDVQFLRGHFGGNFADPSLLIVAAHKIPGGSKKSHPLLEPLRRLVRNPQTDRNVWYLREKGALSDTAYDFVLRFLAYGAIAQNPRQFGLDAPALVF